MEARSAYRRLLKALRTHVTKDPSKSFFADFVSTEFRKHASLSDRALALKKVQLAEDYTMLLSTVHHHKELLYSYNIAIDRAAEQKERMKNTAERVGLQLPKLEYETDEELPR